MTEPDRRSFTPTSGAVLALFLALALAVTAIAFPQLDRFFQLQAGERGQDTLRLTVEGLNGALRRYEPLPGLIAERPILRQLLRAPSDRGLQDKVNEELRQTAFRLKASDVYLMDITGLTLAASSYKKELSFVGRNFNYRPYFTQALEGGLGRYFALGTTSGERGYFYAYPVEDGERILGVVAVKFTVDGFEETWRGGNKDVIVSDLKGVVFMSSRPEWHFKTLRPLTQTERTEIEVFRQYPVDQVELLPNQVERLSEAHNLISIDEAGGAARYVTSTHYISDAGWDVTVLIPTARARTQTLAALSILVLAIMLLGLAVAFYLQRRARLLERIEAQNSARELLETRVIERTADLNRVNEQLVEEVSERRAAELRLRQTQAELVQAGKLAALGQMSAALSHEFNQPLAAVKSFADNAITLLDRHREGEARDNIGRISSMADRMAVISKHLRNFARRPQEKVRPVSLVSVTQDAIALLQARLQASNAELRFKSIEEDPWVMGGYVRLQQVIVNLLNNALDAAQGTKDPVVEIELVMDERTCRVKVRDHGPGIEDANLGKVFDPFFTTKLPGKGLGLGLSISYNIVKDFDGRLLAANHPDGGAVFTIELMQADADAPAVEEHASVAE